MQSAHLEKVLRHAERKLVNESHRKPTDLLDLYRKFLKIEEHRLKLEHGSGQGGRTIALQRANLMSVVLRHVWQGAWENACRAHSEEPPRIALLAVGGFGRGELNPYSDIDILFIYEKVKRQQPAAVTDIVEQVLYMLWDVGFHVGHATRTLDEVMAQGNEDLQTKTALLEARYLCGDEGLWKEFERTFDRMCIQGKEREYINWRLSDQEQRHRKYNKTVFLQEPNVKNGCGGLRDYQSLLWMARVRRGIRSTQGLQEAQFLTPTERKQLDQAYDFLLRVRTELHYLQKRGGDILTLQLQGKIANSFRYHHRNILRRTEALMRHYYQHANTIFLITNSLSLRLAGENEKSARMKWKILPFRAVRAEKVDGFVIQNKMIEAAESGIFSADPLRILRVFVIAQQRGAEIGPDLAFRIRRRLSLINRSFIYQPAVREMLLTISSKKGEVGRIFRRMHEMGVLGRLFPEFAPLTCLVQHEFFHRYTADEHTLVCIEMLDRIMESNDPVFERYTPLMKKIEHPHLLYLAMLLHDTGKSSNSRHHAEDSAVNAVKVSRRLRLSARELSTLVFLVDHHLTMSETCRRKNLDDEDTINEFARVVQTQERLDMLMLLTFADGQGTQERGNWSDWKELLSWQLYHRTTEALAGNREFVVAAQKSLGELKEKIKSRVGRDLAPSEIEAHFQNLPTSYFNSLSEELIVSHLRLVHRFLWQQMMEEDSALKPIFSWIDHPAQGHSEVTVVTWDRGRIFAKICGAFASCGLSILSAHIYTRSDDIVIDTFRVTTDRFGSANDERDKKAFSEILTKALSVDQFDFTQKRPAPMAGFEGAEFPIKITFDQRSSRQYTLLDLQCPDRPGLLYEVASCLAEAKMEVAFARITTEKGAALDTFYLFDRTRGKISDDKALKELTEKLKESLSP